MSSAIELHSTLFFETPEQIFDRVFRAVRPKSVPPAVVVEFCAFANANSFVRLANGQIHVRISDLLKEAPAPVLEALAYILLCKLYRKPIPRACSHRYRLYLNGREVRSEIHRIRRERGRKQITAAQGRVYNLVELFEELNLRYFGGMMSRPDLGWSRRPSRSTLGHYDPSHHAIVLSRILDSVSVPRIAVEYVMFHEMLHLRYPVEHRGTRRCVHTAEFKQAERHFVGLAEAKEALKRLS